MYTFLVAAIGQMFNGVEPDRAARSRHAGLQGGDDAPQRGVCAAVLELIELREASAGQDGRPPRFVPGLPSDRAAAGITRTPDVPLPGRA